MKFDRIDFIARAAAALADADGIRAGSASVVENLIRVLGGRFAFFARRRRDSDIAEIIAAGGLGAADYRRLEERISRSGLWKMLHLTSPFVIDDLGGDVVLNFLSFGTGAQTLIAVPVIARGTNLGMLAVAFPDRTAVNENDVIKLLKAIAAIAAQAMRVDQMASEQSRKLSEENTLLRQELREKYDFRHLIGNSGPMRQVFDLVAQVARSNATVLVRGESGTGKELIAHAIHYNSLRSKQPFVTVNCSSVPEAVIERVLFGDESSPAAKPKRGRIEQADGGTLFLDEIGDLSLQIQSRLLRLIENREFERSGGQGPVPVNVRLITATSQDLESEIADGAFRDDLYYRLNAFSIYVPPLRERKSDILLLAEHFLERFEREHGKRVRRISTPAIDMLTAYHFPGNVRELENVIEHAVIVSDSNVIHGHHLPPTLQTAEVSGTETRVTLTSAVEAFESDMIQDALKSTRGNITKAARMLHSTERILGYKVRKYGIDPIRFRK